MNEIFNNQQQQKANEKVTLQNNKPLKQIRHKTKKPPIENEH